ncbi:hypothetical protein L2E82_13293 [Cichorium intybus]|uniref:Uncharacterized protein n=1 Tax=Cichorium intybus TaxID=13427 RepID=A0ACB9GJK4_CICIN|nr:hypothetical protein L2E82_13293 [Cichorium intybus]
MYSHISEISGQKAPLVAEDVYRIIMEHAEILDKEIKHERDFEYDIIGFKTLERCYLLKIKGKVVERPQHMLMRISVGIHNNDITSVIKTYRLMSQRWFTHASPTLFNAGTPNPQLSSCFLVCMKDDSIEGFYDALKECAVISKSAGGIGVSIHNTRLNGSYICGPNGTSNGIIPMLRVFNDTIRYVDEEGGSRKGAFAVYLEPWHADIFEFLDLRKNHGKGKAKKVVNALELWSAVLKSQIETGTPYMLFKQSAESEPSNLQVCVLTAEIIEYTSPTEIAECNLASIALPRFVQEEGAQEESQPSELVGSRGSGNRYFDFSKLAEVWL